MDRNVSTRIKIRNGQILQAIVKWTLVSETKNGTRNIKEVMLIPILDNKSLTI